MTKDIAVVIDSRSDAIKLAGVIAELGDRARILTTGSASADTGPLCAPNGFDPGTPEALTDGLDNRDRSTRIAAAISTFAASFDRDRPSAVIVHGASDAASACAQAANHAGIPIVTVDAGLRSFDRTLPEELNRHLIDVLADVHCTSTRLNQSNLVAEGVNPLRIALTGTTVIEATLTSLERGDGIVAKHFPERIAPSRYVLACIEHPENSGTKSAIRRLLIGLVGIRTAVILVASPETRAAIERFGLASYLDALTVIAPIEHADFLDLALGATLVVTDSGPVQEECTVLKKPVLVIRRSTEHPEAIDAGFATLVPPSRDIASVANVILSDQQVSSALQGAPSPYGDGSASLQIALIAARIADGFSPANAVTGLADDSL